MTVSTLRPHADPAESSVVGRVAQLVEELAAIAGTGCLVEGPGGRLLAHHLSRSDVPAAVVRALVTGSLGPLHDALSGRRAVGCLPAGPVVEGVLGDGGPAVAHVLLREGLGTVWLLPSSGRGLVLEHVSDLVDRLRVALGATCDDEDGAALRAWLDAEPGAGLPEPLATCSRVWLVVSVDPAAVCRAVPARYVARVAGRFAVVGAPASAGARQLAAAVVHALPEDSGAVCVEVADRADPSREREALEAARGAAPAGCCVPLSDVRGAVVARRVAEALSSLPDLGADPLARLSSYDGRRGSELAVTLRTWLDCFGDAPAVSQALGVHANTLRYRLKRIQEITGVDLRHDSLGRLELHLRLLAPTTRSAR